MKVWPVVLVTGIVGLGIGLTPVLLRQRGTAEVADGQPITRTAPVAQASQAPTAASTSPGAVSTYSKECGACHVAYPPQLLPTRSWAALLGNLGNHFGDNAELPDATRAELLPWLTTNAADTRGSRIMARIPATETPLRITELSWFVGQHHEVPDAIVTGTAEIKRWSNCGACHTGAAQGRYGEHEIRIPGRGSWED